MKRELKDYSKCILVGNKSKMESFRQSLKCPERYAVVELRAELTNTFELDKQKGDYCLVEILKGVFEK